jgi:phosphatidylglycerol:prolipoprotein diacylglycerol transferase
MFIHNIDPVLFSIGPLEIRYYGIIYLLGFFLAYIILRWLAPKKLGISKEKVLDYIFWIAIGIIVGARLFYVFIYNPSYYLLRLWEALYIWQGGLSFHGGLIGGIIAAVIFCKKNKISLFRMADLTALPLAFALSLGRIANFLNAELVGRPSSLPWCVKFPTAEGCRHPSQIYASLKDLFIFSLLFFLRDKKMKDGTLFSIFLLLYGSLRFIVGFFRAPDPQISYIFNLTMGQWLSILTFIAGAALYISINKTKLDIARK